MSDFTSTESDIVLLGEIASIARGTINPNEAPLEVFNYYSIPGYDSTGGPSKTLGKEIQSNKTILNDECVLVSKLNPRIPRVCLVSISGDSRSICSTEFIPLVPKGQAIDLEYLAHYLRSPSFQERFQAAAGGSTNSHSRVTPSEILDWDIFVPPLPEQEKIAEILSGIDSSIRARESSIRKTDDILWSMKEDLMAGVEEWQEYELGELLAFRNGLNTEKENFGQGVPFVSYKNVYSGGILTTKTLTQSVSLSAVEEERFLLKSGDILFTRTSETPDEIGFSCVFDDRHGGAVFNGFCIRGRPLEEGKLTPDFASFYLRSESVLAQMRFLCKYTTRAGISAESLSRVKIRIPDNKTQQRLAGSLIAVKEYRATQEESLQNLKNIKKSVSADLLSGRKRVSV
jgi:type I restriction enzyme S subunit